LSSSSLFSLFLPFFPSFSLFSSVSSSYSFLICSFLLLFLRNFLQFLRIIVLFLFYFSSSPYLTFLALRVFLSSVFPSSFPYSSVHIIFLK
jgi:hypothetical protein